jgi:hypothetical protein
MKSVREERRERCGFGYQGATLPIPSGLLPDFDNLRRPVRRSA